MKQALGRLDIFTESEFLECFRTHLRIAKEVLQDDISKEQVRDWIDKQWCPFVYLNHYICLKKGGNCSTCALCPLTDPENFYSEKYRKCEGYYITHKSSYNLRKKMKKIVEEEFS